MKEPRPQYGIKVTNKALSVVSNIELVHNLVMGQWSSLALQDVRPQSHIYQTTDNDGSEGIPCQIAHQSNCNKVPPTS